MGSPMWRRFRTMCRKEIIWNVVLLKAGQESTPGFARLFVCLFLTLHFFPDHAFLLRTDTNIIRKVSTLREHSQGALISKDGRAQVLWGIGTWFHHSNLYCVPWRLMVAALER